MKRKKYSIGHHYGEARQERQKQRRRFLWYAITAGIILILIGLLYVLMYSGLLKIDSFQVKSTSEIDSHLLLQQLKTQAKQSRRGALFGTNHYFGWSADAQSYKLPNFSSIQVNKSLRRRELIIQAIPRVRFGVWCQELVLAELDHPQTDCYWIDDAGLVFARGPLVEGQLIPAIYEDANAAPATTIGKPALDADTFAKLKTILAGIRSLDISAAKITLDRASQELHIYTATNTRIMFSTRFDPTSTALPALARIQKNPGFRNLEYINLTVENRAFYKAR